MTTLKNKNVMIKVLLVLCLLISSGFGAKGLPYDYSFTSECLENPLKPQYDGGIAVNPEMEEGLKGWSTYGGANLVEKESEGGNKFIVVSNRKASYDSLSQQFILDHRMLYTISAWLQLSQGESEVAAICRTATGSGYVVGWTIARSGCWSMLKGGLVVNASGPAKLYFHSDNPNVEIWADSISLQPFSEDEWKTHQIQSIDKTRRRKVRFRVVDPQDRALAGANISIKQLNNEFPFGCAISGNILRNQAYQDWFTSRFKYTVFENEMKWYSTEKRPGHENYSVTDSMLEFAKRHSIQVRGHNVFWDDPDYNPSWLLELSQDLSPVLDRRIKAIMERYSGQLIHWDVVNENLHFSFLEDRIGETASAVYYQKAYDIDSSAIPFLNEYNTIEKSSEQSTSPARYLKKIKQLRSEGYEGPLGIGLEGHFSVPNLAYIRAAIDVLASANLPIWITELDVSSRPNQELYLEQIIRETHAHHAVKGILIWAAWSPKRCYRMCLTDNNFKNLPTGDVVDKILAEMTHKGLMGITDASGFFETSLFYGDYVVQVSNPDAANSIATKKFRVTS